METPVLFEVENSTAVITLNRPERKNSINRELLKNLYESLERVCADNDIKAAIITGAGNSFCSGIDLAAIATENLFDIRPDGSDLPDIFASCGKPVIAAVNGYAITGGFEIALNCDFIIASDNASFADTHARVGIHPGWGMTQLLQQAVGQRMAKQLSLTCAFVSADEALRIGLVNEVVPRDNLLIRAKEIASQICAAKPDMMLKIKGLIESANASTLNDAYAGERSGFREFVKTNLKR